MFCRTSFGEKLVKDACSDGLSLECEVNMKTTVLPSICSVGTEGARAEKSGRAGLGLNRVEAVEDLEGPSWDLLKGTAHFPTRSW